MITIETPYTGHVSPGSNPQQRDVPGARILKMSVGGADNNVYLIQETLSGAAVLIDAANEPEKLVELIAQEAPETVQLIVTTHQHIDHWWALPNVAALGIPTAAHELDAGPLPVTPDRLLADGDTVDIGELTFTVIHLRGHTPGSITLAFTDGAGQTHLFTGDSLFPGGLGKTATSEDFDSLYHDAVTKLFDRYPDDTIVYPGHGDDTTLGAERGQLPEWRARGW